MEDDLFSKLAWDSPFHERSGKITLANGKTAKFEIDIPATDPMTEAAWNTVKFLVANEPRIRHKIAVSVIAHYQDTWFDDFAITPEELTQRINLLNITFWEEGGGALYYDPDDSLLGGHCICASIDPNGEIDEPQIEG